tara:strand:+ start:29357 stop:30136 length:780 start_codon:yes stop_codon:yes gene_type:complete
MRLEEAVADVEIAPMKFLAAFCILVSLSLISAPETFAGGAMVLYFDAIAGDDASPGDDNGQQDGGGVGGSAPGGAASGGGAGAAGSGNSSSGLGALASGSANEGTQSDASEGDLLQSIAESSLTPTSIVDELSIANNPISSENGLGVTPPSGSEVDPESTPTQELVAAPFPTSLPPFAPLPIVPTPATPTMINPPATPSGPGTPIIPSTPTMTSVPIAGPTLTNVPQAATATPEPSSAIVWLMGAITLAGFKRRTRTDR